MEDNDMWSAYLQAAQLIRK